MRCVYQAFACAMFAALSLGSSCDPVHGDAVDALGGEAAGVGPGPLHRGGQPCLLCHDGAIGNPTKFSVAGTVYDAPSTAQPVAGVTVTMTSLHDGASFTATTNEAGNFYATPTEWAPAYPIKVTMKSGGKSICMTTHIGRDGSCAGCHVEPAGQASPGRIVVAPPTNLLNVGCTP